MLQRSILTAKLLNIARCLEIVNGCLIVLQPFVHDMLKQKSIAAHYAIFHVLDLELLNLWIMLDYLIHKCCFAALLDFVNWALRGLNLLDETKILIIQEAVNLVASLTFVIAPHRLKIWYIIPLNKEFFTFVEWIVVNLPIFFLSVIFRGETSSAVTFDFHHRMVNLHMTCVRASNAVDVWVCLICARNSWGLAIHSSIECIFLRVNVELVHHQLRVVIIVAFKLIIGDECLICTLHTLAFSSIDGLNRLGKILRPT